MKTGSLGILSIFPLQTSFFFHFPNKKDVSRCCRCYIILRSFNSHHFFFKPKATAPLFCSFLVVFLFIYCTYIGNNLEFSGRFGIKTRFHFQFFPDVLLWMTLQSSSITPIKCMSFAHYAHWIMVITRQFIWQWGNGFNQEAVRWPKIEIYLSPHRMFKGFHLTTSNHMQALSKPVDSNVLKTKNTTSCL